LAKCAKFWKDAKITMDNLVEGKHSNRKGEVNKSGIWEWDWGIKKLKETQY
jgi:hypothetical protein